MSAQVIDLLSSDDEPAKAKLPLKGKNPPRQVPAPAKARVPFKSLAISNLFSDEDEDTHSPPSKPPVRPASKTKPPSTKRVAKPKTTTNPQKKSNTRSFDPESSDSDGFDFAAFDGSTAVAAPKPTPAISTKSAPAIMTKSPDSQRPSSIVASRSYSASEAHQPNNKLPSSDEVSAKIRMALEDKALKDKAMEDKRRQEKEDEEFARMLERSDYDLDRPNLPLPKVAFKEQTQSSSLPKPSSTSNGLSQSTNPTKGDFGFAFLSDDFDTTADLDSSVNQPSSASGLLGLDRKKMEEERLARFNGLNNGLKPMSLEAPKHDIESKKRRASSPPLPVIENDELPLPKKRQLSPPRATKAKRSGYRRSQSNIEISSKSVQPKPNISRSRSALESDPLMFTSSPDPYEALKLKRKAKQMGILHEDDSDIDIHFGIPKNRPGQSAPVGSGGSESSDFEFPDIDELPSKPFSKSGSKPKSKPTPATKAKISQPKGPLTALEKYEAEREKEVEKTRKAEEKAQRAREKEAEKEQKRLAREEKKHEKGRAAELAKVNTLRTDKKVSTPEMIVDLPTLSGDSSLDKMGKAQGQNLATKARLFLDTLNVEVTDYESSQSIVKWRRKVNAEFNEDLGIWEPIDKPYKKAEKHIMYVMTAKEFVELAIGEEGQDLDMHVVLLQSKFSSNEIIYLIQDLQSWMRNNRNLKNRKYQAAMRSQEQELTATGRPKKKKAEPEYIDENLIEEALLKLQVVHGMPIHHTKSLQETSEMIRAFTQHISTIPYK